MHGVYVPGVTYALAAIFSTGQRKQLLPFASQMWTDAAQLLNSRTAASSVVARKFATKLVQRIGLTFLPATVASWRYQQNSVSINESLCNIRSVKPSSEVCDSAASDSVTSDSAQRIQQSASSAPSQTESSDPAYGMANGDSSRPALQPSPLVNASPVVSPTSKACTTGSDRPVTASSGDTNAPKASAKASDPSVHESKARDAMQQSTNSVAAATAEEEAEDDDLDIPDEIEEVKKILTMLCILCYALFAIVYQSMHACCGKFCHLSLQHCELVSPQGKHFALLDVYRLPQPPCRDAQDRLWSNKTCPASTLLIMSWNATVSFVITSSVTVTSTMAISTIMVITVITFFLLLSLLILLVL